MTSFILDEARGYRRAIGSGVLKPSISCTSLNMYYFKCHPRCVWRLDPMPGFHYHHRNGLVKSDLGIDSRAKFTE
jgi:hypothetical protein